MGPGEAKVCVCVLAGDARQQQIRLIQHQELQARTDDQRLRLDQLTRTAGRGHYNVGAGD